ncbi:MAG: hypothetical protein ACRC5C_02950, partial [Bacilli bacterium]
DVVVKQTNSVRLWGQIKDCNGRPVPYALIKLLVPCYVQGRMEYRGVAHTAADCNGFYQFDLCVKDQPTKYRLLVGKAAVGNERVDNGVVTCNPCNAPDICIQNPCGN